MSGSGPGVEVGSETLRLEFDFELTKVHAGDARSIGSVELKDASVDRDIQEQQESC